MLRILRNRKAQNTAEYAILFAVVVGAFTSMQIYVKRGLNARIKDGINTIPFIVTGQETTAATVVAKMFNSTSGSSSLKQYEPYYVRGGAVDMTSDNSQGTETGTVTEAGGITNTTDATSRRHGTQIMTGTFEE